MAQPSGGGVCLTRALALVVALASTLGCATGPDPAMKKRTDELLASVAKSRREIRAPTAFEPKPWVAGQWVLYLTKMKGELMVQRTSILSRDAKGFWVEIDSQDYRRRSILKILFLRQPRTAREAMENAAVVVAKIGDQKPERLAFTASRGASEMTEFMAAGVRSVVLTSDELVSGRTNVSTRAGLFHDCLSFVANIAVDLSARQVRGWQHPEVPVSGLVNGASSDGEVVVELLDYGETGAKSALPEK